MGVSLIYQAMPTRCRLYARLQNDAAFNAFLVALFPYGRGVLHLLANEPDEAEELLEEAIERHGEALGSEARGRIEEFLAAAEKAMSASPGVESRTASLEKCSFDVEGRLARHLAGRVRDAPALAKRLICGDGSLAAQLRPRARIF